MKLPLFSLLLLLLSAGSHAQISRSALFLGNSYTSVNNLPQMIQNIATSQGNQFTYSSNTPGAYYFRLHAINSLVDIDNDNYDYLILQQHSTRLAIQENGDAAYCNESFPYAEFLDHRSRLVNECHKTMFYLTWGRKEGNSIYVPPYYYGANYEGMQDNLTENYLQLANQLDAEVTPVGEVWRQMTIQHPNIELYSGDGSHPSITGTYLAACTFYATIFHANMNQIWIPSGVSELTAQKIQNIVNEEVIQSWSEWNIDVSNSDCESLGLSHNSEDWSTQSLGDFKKLNRIQFTNNQHGYIKGTKGAWQTIDSGNNWLEIELPSEPPLSSSNENHFDIFYANKDTVWYTLGTDEVDSSTMVFVGLVDGFKGEFSAYVRSFRSIDGGDSWEERSPYRPDHEILDSASLDSRPGFTNMRIHFDDGMHGTLYCNYGEDGDSLVHSFWTEDGGLSWNGNITEVGKTSSHLWFQNSFEAYKSGSKDSNQVNFPQKLFKTEDRGASWQEVVSFPDSCCKGPENIYHYFSTFEKIGTDTLIAIKSLYSPTFYRSVDNGATWDSLSVIRIAGKVHDFIKLPNGVYLICTGDGSGDDLFSPGDRFGRIFASYDFGETWVEEAYFEYGCYSLASTDDYVFSVGSNENVYRKNISLFSPYTISPIEPSTFSLFPNPTEGSVTLEGMPAYAEIEIYSILGSLIKKTKANIFGNAELLLDQVASGQYLVKVYFPNNVVTKKLILAPKN